RLSAVIDLRTGHVALPIALVHHAHLEAPQLDRGQLAYARQRVCLRGQRDLENLVLRPAERVGEPADHLDLPLRQSLSSCVLLIRAELHLRRRAERDNRREGLFLADYEPLHDVLPLVVPLTCRTCSRSPLCDSTSACI